ncbi:MAG: DUF2510 domain-containing protein [Acidimicrobiales bacterium]|nr:DUF2510 domain-containing protein [Acidimicrobiales bacterium]
MEERSREDRLRPATGGTSGSDVEVDAPNLTRPTEIGWYRDRDDSSMQRFWDGMAWSGPIAAGTRATEDSIPRLLVG